MFHSVDEHTGSAVEAQVGDTQRKWSGLLAGYDGSAAHLAFITLG
jgi:hypothetical protein